MRHRSKKIDDALTALQRAISEEDYAKDRLAEYDKIAAKARKLMEASMLDLLDCYTIVVELSKTLPAPAKEET